MISREIAVQVCLQSIEERMDFIQNQLDELSKGIENEGKSSAGDKHETSISMMQLEQEKLGSQIQLVMEQKSQLLRLVKIEKTTKAGNGRLICTNHGLYFLGTSLGKITIDSNSFFAISVQSPFGQILMGKEVGHSFSFNGKDYQITSIE
jgi:hypothetical protein